MSQSWPGVCLMVLLIVGGCSMHLSPACDWFPTLDFVDISLSCCSPHMQGPPLLLPQSLQALRLSQTRLRVLDSRVFMGRRLPNLRSLSITDGALSVVAPRALCSLKALAVLDLSNSTLIHLDDSSFECNSQLRRLDLSDNPGLGRLPPLVSASIDTLDADRCNIADVGAEDLGGMPALRILHLSGNADLDCSAVKSRLSRDRPSLRVVCDDATGSASPLLSVTSSDSNNTKPETDSKNPNRQVPVAEVKISAVTPNGSSTTRDVTAWPKSSAAATVGHTADTFTNPEQLSELEFIFAIYRGVALSLILYLSLLPYLKKGAGKKLAC